MNIVTFSNTLSSVPIVAIVNQFIAMQIQILIAAHILALLSLLTALFSILSARRFKQYDTAGGIKYRKISQYVMTLAVVVCALVVTSITAYAKLHPSTKSPNQCSTSIQR